MAVAEDETIYADMEAERRQDLARALQLNDDELTTHHETVRQAKERDALDELDP